MFRKEAVEYKKSSWAGSALLIRGISLWYYFISLFLFVSLFLGLICFTDYTQRINVSGEIITYPNSINIYSPQQGYVSAQFVSVGEYVKKGQNLYKIDVNKVIAAGNASEKYKIEIEKQINNIDSIINKLNFSKKSMHSNMLFQIKEHQKIHEQSVKTLKEIKIGLEFAKTIVESYKKYQMQGLINKEQLVNQSNSLLQLQSTYQNIRNDIMTESMQIINLESDIVLRLAEYDNQILQNETQKSDLLRQLAEVDTSNEIIINAPSDGKIESLSVTEGQMVNINDSLLQISPSTIAVYELVLWVPNNSIPYISIGQVVNIRYDAFPYEKYGQFPGKIKNISNIPASYQEISKYNNIPINQIELKAESFYKVTVSIDDKRISYNNKIIFITTGMRAEATLFLEKRPIYKWILSPYYNMKNSITGPINE